MHDINYDNIGPLKVMHLHFPKTDFRAIVVIDNIALGPAIGGVRVSRSVTSEEVIRLARTMTLKNSIAGLPHGGGKAAINADPGDRQIERYFRLFARQIKNLKEYIPGPDMGSNEQCMAWIYDETGNSAGLPEEIGGLPLDKLGATGFGLTECADIACQYMGIDLKGATTGIHGFGSVGKAAADFFSKKGSVIVAVSDTKGTIYNNNGIDINKLLEIKKSSGSVIHYRDGIIRKPEEIFSLPCDILIPAATPDVIHAGNVGDIKAKIILQGANMPVTDDAEEILHQKGILSVPDFISNAGGVIMAAMEYGKRTEKEAFYAISSKIRANTKMILERAKEENAMPRKIAVELAKERVLKAMRYRDCF